MNKNKAGVFIDLIEKLVEQKIAGMPRNDVYVGQVKSITPLQIKLSDGLIIDGTNLILTEGVIRKEFHIAVHTHLFEENTFVHSHSDNNVLQHNTDWDHTHNFAPVPTQLGPQTVNVISTTGKINLKNGQKKYDLTHDSKTDFETLPNAKPSQSTITVKINGEEYPLSKDPMSQVEDDVDGTTKYWAVLNYGLKKGDLVLLLSCNEGNMFVILSKVYGHAEFREDK